MRRFLSLIVLLAVVGGIAMATWTIRKTGIPRQHDALEQYFFARSNYFEPGFNARGAERERLLRLAVEAMQMVTDGFPQAEAVTTRALAEYDSGLCYRALGETERARDAFLRARDYRRYTVGDARKHMHPSGRDTITVIVNAAANQIREIDGRM